MLKNTLNLHSIIASKAKVKEKHIAVGVKIFVAMIFIHFMFVSVLPPSVNGATMKKGIVVDVARKHYSLDSLKQIVDEIPKSPEMYLQLHFSDDENYGIESDNFKSKDYLSKSSVKELISYANDKDIMIVPDIDFPSHSGALLSNIKTKDEKLYNAIVSDYDPNTIDFYDNKKALSTTKKQIKEITELFKQPQFEDKQRIVLGGDEVPGAIKNQSSFIKYMNEIGEYANQMGYAPQLWNDSLTQEGLKDLYQKYSVLYWSQHKKEANNTGLTVEDLAKENFKVYNYNFYSLTFSPSKDFDDDDIVNQADYMGRAYDKNKFNYVDDPYHEVNTSNVEGSALTFWGEKAQSLTQKELLKQEIPLIKKFFNLK